MTLSCVLAVSIALLLLLVSIPVDSRAFYRSHICAMVNNKPRCCMGWALDETNLHCTQPVCTGRCEIAGGRCLSPDTCLCPGGYVAFSCYVGKQTESQPSPVCDIRCKNGGTCEADKCRCRKGFSGLNCEIVSCPNNCTKRGTCRSNGKCECYQGFSGNDCSEQLTAPCFMEVSRGLCRKEIKGRPTTLENCCNSIGKAWGMPCKKCPQSRCRRGFAYQLSTARCEDINECQEISGICKGGTCRNKEGNYKCVCPLGMVYDVNKLSCVAEFDKCSRNPGICGQGQCISRPGGGYRCECNIGYKLSADGTTCKSRASYLTYDMCHYNRGYLCANGECIPQGRSYRCRCNSGYQPSSDGRSCKKVQDFCKLYESRVCDNGICRPVGKNDYRCDCDDGYEVTADQRSCVSTCERYGDTLCPNGQCIPSKKGGYACKCNKGYYQTLSQKKCVRAARVLSTVCDFYSLCSNGRCVPTGRSYRCECNAGFDRASDGKSCQRAERITKNHICDLFPDYYCPNAKCLKIGKDYRCQCSEGYEWTQGKCRRKPRSQPRRKGITKRGKVHGLTSNFCTRYTQLCENGRCVPTSNYFYCECDPGYKPVDDKRRCRRDETKPAKMTSGLYDFCYFYKDSACKGGTCHNEPATFWCTCPPGYYWLAKQLQCVQDNRQQIASDQWDAYSDGNPASYNWRRKTRWYFSACDKMGRDVCGKGYCVDKGSSFECRCHEGYESMQHNKRCVDINECDRNPSICWQGQCVNTPGSYSCRCLKGFKLSHMNRQPMCVDRNECEEGNPCINGACRNVWGSYKCICYDGYVNDDTGHQCLPSGNYEVQQRRNANRSKPAEVRADQRVVEKKEMVNNCSLCRYDCRWINNGEYQCECPKGLVSLGNSEYLGTDRDSRIRGYFSLCVEDDSVSDYTFEIQMDDTKKTRRKRSAPDTSAASPSRVRIVLRDNVDADKFTNSISSRYSNSHIYKIVKLGIMNNSKGKKTDDVVDVVFN